MIGARTLRLPAAVVFAVGFIFLFAPSAEAHSVLQRSTPGRDAILRLPPREVTLSFTQRFDPRFSRVQVFSGSGRLLVEGAKSSADRRVMRVALPALLPGVYTVRWQAHSAIDGHTTRGSFKFTVRSQRSDAALKGTGKGRGEARPGPQGKPGNLTPPLAPDSGRRVQAPPVGHRLGTLLRRFPGPWRAPAPSSSQRDPHQARQGLLDGPDRAEAFSKIIQVAIRWESLVTVFLLAGMAIFQALVLGPLSHRLGVDDQWIVAGASRLRRLMMGGACAALLLLAGEASLLAIDLMQSARTILDPGRLGELVLETKPGWSILLRACAAALLLLPGGAIGQALQGAALALSVVIAGAMKFYGMAPSDVIPWLRSSWMLPSAIAVVGAVIPTAIVPRTVGAGRSPILRPLVVATLLVMGLIPTSNAVSWGGPAMLADAAHIFAGAIWVGGLVALGIVLQVLPPALRSTASRVMLPAFSRLAAVSLVVLVTTGFYMMKLYVPRLDELTAGLYGQTLLAKLALIGPLVALGALSRFRRAPKAADTGQARLRGFLRLARFDMVLTLAVLGIASVLVLRPPSEAKEPGISTAPSAPQTQTSVAEAFGLTQRAGDLDVHLRIVPGPDGRNRFEAVLTDRWGRPVSGSATLRAKALGSSKVFTLPSIGRGGGRYRFAAGIAAAGEKWEVQVIVRRKGRADVRATFIVSPLSSPAR